MAVDIILRAEQVAIFAAGIVLWVANGGPPLLWSRPGCWSTSR